MIPTVVRSSIPIPQTKTVVLGVPKPVITRGKQNRKPSLRQQKAVANLVENGGNKRKALKDAGYSKAVQDNPEKVFGSDAVQTVMDPVLNNMRTIREEVLRRMSKTISRANFAVLSMALKGLNHDIQLFESKPTEIITPSLSEEERSALDKLVERNK